MLAQMRAKKIPESGKFAEMLRNYIVIIPPANEKNANVELGDVQKHVNLVDDDCEKCCNINISKLNYFESVFIYFLFSY